MRDNKLNNNINKLFNKNKININKLFNKNKLNNNINKLFKRKNTMPAKNIVPAKKKCSPCEKRRLERERLARLNKSANLKPCKHCPNQ